MNSAVKYKPISNIRVNKQNPGQRPHLTSEIRSSNPVTKQSGIDTLLLNLLTTSYLACKKLSKLVMS